MSPLVFLGRRDGEANPSAGPEETPRPVVPPGMRWRLSFRADPAARALADRHYNRQRVGHPQFVPPGRCLVLVAGDPVCAVWVTSWPLARYVKHAWAGAWVCSIFRNEGAGLSSELIAEAVAATRWYCAHGPASWREPEPDLGIITFVDATRIRGDNPGACYRRAAWRRVGVTREQGLIALQQLPAAMPAARPPRNASLPLFAAGAA